MNNSNPYNGDAFDFYKKVCAKKQCATLKARLLIIDPDIQALFNTYDNHFAANNLELINSKGYINPKKSDLEELYNYKSVTLRKLKTELSSSTSGRMVKCQNCTINDVNTFDHLLPQSEFSEYIVHPRNLICSCGDCNSRKNNIWRNSGKRITLNLYLDKLPTIQYLFVITKVSNTSIDIKYYLDNRNGVDTNLFQLIKEHYSRLNLFERFVESSDTVITSLKNILSSLTNNIEPTLARKIIIDSIQRDQLAFGHNYWQSILKLELINNTDFMSNFKVDC